jgi:hypothetical protein
MLTEFFITSISGLPGYVSSPLSINMVVSVSSVSSIPAFISHSYPLPDLYVGFQTPPPPPHRNVVFFETGAHQYLTHVITKRGSYMLKYRYISVPHIRIDSEEF